MKIFNLKIIVFLALVGSFLSCPTVEGGTVIGHPNSDVIYQWTRSEATGWWYEYVDEVAGCNDATDYLYSNTVNDTILFRVTDFPIGESGMGVDSVGIHYCDYHPTGLTIAKYKGFLRIGSDAIVSDQRTPPASWGSWDWDVVTPPGGRSWNVWNVDTIEIGAIITADGGDVVAQISQIKLTVYYTCDSSITYLIILPVADGEAVEWDVSGCTNDWECVDEGKDSDEATSFVYKVESESDSTYEHFYFKYTDICYADADSLDSLVIVYETRRTGSPDGSNTAKAMVKKASEANIETHGTDLRGYTFWDTRRKVWATDPYDASRWLISDIWDTDTDSLQAGMWREAGSDENQFQVTSLKMILYKYQEPGEGQVIIINFGD